MIKTGTYTGDGGATQAITGVGFTPYHITILPQLDPQVEGFTPAKSGVDDAGDAAFYILQFQIFGYGNNDHILSLDADGFTVGDGTGFRNVFNINLQVYTYICIG